MRTQLSKEDNECVQYIRLTDPHHDKTRIEKTKGGLLDDCYRWILDHPDFKRWKWDSQSRLLWINGDAGKGKTMLLIGIIKELEELTKKPDTGLLAFFLCQATEDKPEQRRCHPTRLDLPTGHSGKPPNFPFPDPVRPGGS